MMSDGKLVVVSGPSGVGKSTLLKRLRELCPAPIHFSVSATTRNPRPGERDGIDYHFLTKEAFENLRANDAFLECFEVFGRGDWYGTLKDEVLPKLNCGRIVLLEIDVNGASQVVKQYPDAITIFIRPSSMEALKQRLAGRGSESEESLLRRFTEAENEMASASRFQHHIVNDDLQRAVKELIVLLCNGEYE